ncbi:MAG: ketopantoate reductase family protein [Spirochaetaceae bacterium]|nr:MAG: ketopantoate reductase family protein [Spirochaetaceae bacterium]
MQHINSILILGAGGLGAAYGTVIHTTKPGLLSFLADGSRALRLRQDGVVVNGTPFFLPVVEPPQTAGESVTSAGADVTPADLILLTVKYHHLADTVELMRPFVGPNTVILSLLNGIDSEEILARSFNSEQILYGMSLGIDAVREGKQVRYSSLGTIYFGRANNEHISPEVRLIQELFAECGIIYETPTDMIRTLWWKFMINVGINQVSAVLEQPYRAFQRPGHAHALMVTAMREVIALAVQRGIDISEEDIEKWNTVIPRLSPDGKTSMLQDVEGRRKTEVEMLAGKVVELGKELEVPTPVNSVLMKLLKAKEEAYTT